MCRAATLSTEKARDRLVVQWQGEQSHARRGFGERQNLIQIGREIGRGHRSRMAPVLTTANNNNNNNNTPTNHHSCAPRPSPRIAPSLPVRDVLQDQVAQLLWPLAKHEISRAAVQLPLVPQAPPEEPAQLWVAAQALPTGGRPGHRKLEESPLGRMRPKEVSLQASGQKEEGGEGSWMCDRYLCEVRVGCFKPFDSVCREWGGGKKGGPKKKSGHLGGRKR